MRNIAPIAALSVLISSGILAEPAARLDKEWPTYHGDDTGQRHSPLAQINAQTVKDLALSWVYHARVPDDGAFLKPAIKSTPVEKDGVLYVTMPNYVWAVDARTGRQVWKYMTKSGSAIGNRGVLVHDKTVYFETPDNHLVALNAVDGKERWRVEIADAKLGYSSTAAPVMAGNHILVAAGGDSLDLPGYLQARDPETGALQWSWRSTPTADQPEAKTWPNADSMEHGAGMLWLPGTYDPELNLIYWGTGNPNPVHAGQGRKGDNLWTCSIVALNPDTGKLVWYYQVSPHDTHDWDAVQTPVLYEGDFGGKPRKLLMQASRNGYFFVLDRATGEHLLTAPFVPVTWAKGLDAKGRPIPDPAKEPRTDGTLVAPSSGGGANWPPPSFDPHAGLLFVPTMNLYSIFYLTDVGEKPSGFGGRDDFLTPDPGVTAIDYKTGKIRWVHKFSPGSVFSGLLSSDGKLVFGGDSEQDFVALDTETGKSLWHVNLGAPVTNAPITYELDGRQYLVVGAGTDIYGFALPVGAELPTVN